MFDPDRHFMQLDHTEPYDNAVAHAIRLCAVLASGQPVSNSDPAECPLVVLTGGELVVFYDEITRYVKCKLRRHRHMRQMWLEIIEIYERLNIISILVCTATTSTETRTTVHSNLMASPDPGKVAAKTLASYEAERPKFRARHGLAVA